ncbi:MAG: hypothetical protein M1482_14965 [Chloroflexi bacterium]|nr:hypothetical protein [Chloroflexota bacterium]
MTNRSPACSGTEISHTGDAAQDSSRRLVPVYSLRNPGDRELAARLLATGKTAAFYGGLYGIVKRVQPEWEAGPGGADTYWQVKAGRPRWSKVPLLIQPKDALRLIDFRLVHPQFQHLRKREHFERLYASHGAPLHVIAPLKEPLPFLHSAFKTSNADLREQAVDKVLTSDRLLPCTTAAFFWMTDPAWEQLAHLLGLYSKRRVFYGVSSFNEHGEQPQYTFDELSRVLERPGAPCVDLVINDEPYENTGAFSSHTQVRLPLSHEAPELIVFRRGAIGPEWLATSTGYPVRVLESASIASRSPGLTDDDLQCRLERFREARGV